MVPSYTNIYKTQKPQNFYDSANKFNYLSNKTIKKNQVIGMKP